MSATWIACSERVPELDGPGALGEDRSRCDTCGCRSLSVYGVQAVYGVRRCAACYDALRDADGSKFRIDATGRAFRLDSSRVPELDGPPAGLHTCPGYCLECATGIDLRNGHGMRATSSSAAPLDRAEAVRVLMREHRLWAAGWSMSKSRRNVPGQSFCCGAQHAIYDLADALGLRAEFDAAVRGEVGRG